MLGELWQIIDGGGEKELRTLLHGRKLLSLEMVLSSRGGGRDMGKVVWGELTAFEEEMEAYWLSRTFVGILSLIPWLPNIAQFLQVHSGIPDFRSGRDLEISEADHFRFQRRKPKADGGQMTCLPCSGRKLLAESGPESTSSNKRKWILTSTPPGFGISSSLNGLGCWSWAPPTALPHWLPSLPCTAP